VVFKEKKNIMWSSGVIRKFRNRVQNKKINLWFIFAFLCNSLKSNKYSTILFQLIKLIH
jgi:hypothetical protein